MIASLISMVVGWLVGFAYFWFCMTYLSDWGHMTDGAGVFVSTGFFSFIGWMIFFLPIVLKVDDRNPLFQVRYFPFFGAVYGLLAFLILCGWMGFYKHVVYWGYAAVIGGVAGLVYSLWLHRKLAA